MSDIGQMSYSTASDLGLHCLLKLVSSCLLRMVSPSTTVNPVQMKTAQPQIHYKEKKNVLNPIANVKIQYFPGQERLVFYTKLLLRRQSA